MTEQKIIDIVKKHKIESMILKFILIITCLSTILLNLKEFRQVFFNTFVINNYSNLNSAITNKYKYITLNLSNAKETRFSLQNNKKEETAKVYEINYGDYNLILVLDKNTALTGKVNGELLKENYNVRTIKEKLMNDSNNNKKYIKSYFSNIDYAKEEQMSKIKFYTVFAIIIFLVGLIILDFIKFLFPKKTLTYRKYVRKIKKI